MAYKNGKDIFPDHLLEEMQKYIQGELVYIPKNGKKRAGWGEINGTRSMIQKRNYEIYQLYHRGWQMEQLTEKYHLSEDSIRKIILMAMR